MSGYVRKRGKKWYYCFDIGMPDGTRKRIERVGGVTKREAQDSLRKAITEYETGFVQPKKLTFDEYITDWIENFVKENRKPATYYRYKGLINKYLIPYLGSMKLNELRPAHIEKMLSESKKSGIGSTTVEYIYKVLNVALNRAKIQRVILWNPCESVERPRKDKFVANVLTVEEFYSILSLLDISSYKDYVFSVALQLILELGLRRGEMSGLVWKNIDFQSNTISIENNLNYTDGVTYVSTPKTLESERILYISDDLKRILKEYKLLQTKNKLLYGPLVIKNCYDSIEYDFIFTWENGEVIHPTYYTRKFRRLMKASSIEKNIRFHDLRHTNATLLLSQGVDFKTIQTRLGHSNINTTLNVYSHVNLEMQKKAVNKLTSVISGDKMATK